MRPEQEQLKLAFEGCPEQFSLSRSRRVVTRSIEHHDGTRTKTMFRFRDPLPLDLDCLGPHSLASSVDGAVLRATEAPATQISGGRVRVADLFSGGGLLSLGVMQACHALGMGFESVLGLDNNEAAAAVFERNFPTALVLREDINRILAGRLGTRLTREERMLARRVAPIDLVVGGPPCQGHSDLNNWTRRDDPKNHLYERMARFVEVMGPSHVIIENVRAVMHDRGRVVDRTLKHLDILGYHVDAGTIDLARLGVPQTRMRHVVVASLSKSIRLKQVQVAYARPVRSVRWAIGDLQKVEATGILDTPSTPTSANAKRINYLFQRGLYDLPNSMRPDCHRLKSHTYISVYGRLAFDKPSQTITSGFGSMGQGRFVHPAARRTLTPHEAARLQMIPDYFDFRDVTQRQSLAEIIGNAVPPKLAYVLATELLR